MIYKPVSPTGGAVFKDLGLCITCPVCNFDYVHFEGEPPRTSPWAGQGTAVIIPMACENGLHPFDLGIGFHKGQSWMFTRHAEIPAPIEAHRDANGGGGWHQ